MGILGVIINSNIYKLTLNTSRDIIKASIRRKMGFMSIVKKAKEKEKEMRLLVLGLDNAGKTTIIKKFNGENINEISPTLGFNIKTLEYENFKLNVWDIGGQKTIRSYWRNYF